jgi:hypothetical protein
MFIGYSALPTGPSLTLIQSCLEKHEQSATMLCYTCQEIFTGGRLPKLDGSWSQHLYSLQDLMEGARGRCLICTALKRGISQNGKLEKLGDRAGLYGFVSEYSMRPGMGDSIDLTFKFRYTVSRDHVRASHHMLVRPWNGTSISPCNKFSSTVC